MLQVFVAHFHWIVSTDPYFNAVTPWHWLNKTLEPGFLGVDIFFVLSGFLITSLLLKDWQRNQPGMFRRFYMRRALRLLPALYAILIASFFVALWEKFPMDMVMFTGQVSEDELRRERPAEYERLAASGELAGLEAVPEPPWVSTGGRVIGTLAVITGLVLLGLIVVGVFFE